jgi:hypothetical protein
MLYHKGWHNNRFLLTRLAVVNFHNFDLNGMS